MTHRPIRRGEFRARPPIAAEDGPGAEYGFTLGVDSCAVYEVDREDRVVEIADVPRSSVGAPLPVVVAAEGRLLLAYVAEVEDPSWNGGTPRSVTAESDEPAVRALFEDPRAHMFGPPNDEAFRGHPLAARGLEPYGVFRIERSSWIRRLERMNRVHPQHSPAAFEELSHFVFAFHDSTFECVAQRFTAEVVAGPLSAAVADMARSATLNL